MTSHLVLMVFFAGAVSAVFGTLARDEPREQLRLAVIMTGGFVGSAILLAWLMYPLPL